MQDGHIIEQKSEFLWNIYPAFSCFFCFCLLSGCCSARELHTIKPKPCPPAKSLLCWRSCFPPSDTAIYPSRMPSPPQTMPGRRNGPCSRISPGAFRCLWPHQCRQKLSSQGFHRTPPVPGEMELWDQSGADAFQHNHSYYKREVLFRQSVRTHSVLFMNQRQNPDSDTRAQIESTAFSPSFHAHSPQYP